MLIGYARTSTLQQTNGFEAQVEQLTQFGCEKIYKEKVSSVASRHKLDAAIDNLREGDKLVVCKLDRLARNVSHMGKLLAEIEAKGAGLVILSLGTERVDTTTATGKLILNMMVSVAQFEREMMLERQRKGIQRAKAEGKFTGRAATARSQTDKVLALKAAGVHPNKIQQQLGISRASYYRIVAAAR